jgi:hypothetical protein
MGLAPMGVLRVMLAPAPSYRRLVGQPPAPGLRALVARPLLVALVVGTVVTLTNAGQLFPTLLLGSVISWSWVPALQLAAAAALIAVVRRRPVPLSSAVDLFFRGHLPWSLWLMGLAAVLMVRFPQGLNGASNLRPLFLSALVPIAWTWVITFCFCRTVLALSRARAVAWTLAYQAVIWSSAYLYVGAATHRLWPFAMYASFFG